MLHTLALVRHLDRVTDGLDAHLVDRQLTGVVPGLNIFDLAGGRGSVTGNIAVTHEFNSLHGLIYGRQYNRFQ
jgi:hypothetical protein